MGSPLPGYRIYFCDFIWSKSHPVSLQRWNPNEQFFVSLLAGHHFRRLQNSNFLRINMFRFYHNVKKHFTSGYDIHTFLLIACFKRSVSISKRLYNETNNIRRTQTNVNNKVTIRIFWLWCFLPLEKVCIVILDEYSLNTHPRFEKRFRGWALMKAWKSSWGFWVMYEVSGAR